MNKVTYMPQSNFVNEWQTVDVVVKSLCDILGVPTTMGLDMLTRFNINNGPVRTQSGGSQRKLCLCTVLLAPHDVLIFDEPLVGADKASRLLLFDMIDILMKKNRCIVSTSHTPRDGLYLDVELWGFKDGVVAKVEKETALRVCSDIGTADHEDQYVIVCLFKEAGARAEWEKTARKLNVFVEKKSHSLARSPHCLILRSQQPLDDVEKISKESTRPCSHFRIVPARHERYIV